MIIVLNTDLPLYAQGRRSGTFVVSAKNELKLESQ